VTTTHNELPANINPTGEICISLVIPDDTEWLWLLVKALSHPAAKRYWKGESSQTIEMASNWEERVVTPLVEKILAAELCTTGETMSCEDIADCIETDETVQAALVQNLLTVEMINQITTVVNQNGFGNPNSINTSQTTVVDRNPIGALQEEIKPLVECNLDALWGGIRHGIVERLNDLTKDLLEDLLIIPDVAERLTVFIDVVPVIGDLVEGVAFQITEIIPDLYTLYESYESAETLDELACEIFAIVCSECRYPTFEELFGVYAGHTLISLAMNDLTLDAVATAILDLLTQTAEVAFFTLSVQSLFVLNLQSAFNGANGTRAIVKWAEIGEDSASDNWLTLCETCNEAYRIKVWDYTVEQYNSTRATGFSTNSGTWISGKGWRVDKTAANAGRLTMAQPFDPSWELRGILIKTDKPRASWSSYAVVNRTIVGSGTTGYNMTLTTPSDPNSRCRTGIASESGIQEMAVSITQDPYAVMYLEKIICIFNTDTAPAPTIPTSDPDVCGLS